MTPEQQRATVIAALLETQRPAPRFVTWQELAEMTGVPARACHRIIIAADASPADSPELEFLLAREDDVGASIAIRAADSDELHARLKREDARLAELAETHVVVYGEPD